MVHERWTIEVRGGSETEYVAANKTKDVKTGKSELE